MSRAGLVGAGTSTARIMASALLFAASPAWAARVELVVEPKELQVGQMGTAQVIVTDADTSQPTISPVQGLDVTPTGSSQNFTIVNGAATRSRAFQYQVVARRVGTFTLGPATVLLTGGSGPVNLQTNTVEVKVTEAAVSDVAGATGVDVSTDWDTPVAWDGQVVVFHYRLRTKVELGGAQWFGLPQEGFAMPRDGQPVRKEYRLETPDGPMIVDETWAPLTATGAGIRGQDPAGAQVEIITAGRQRRGIFDMFRPSKIETVMAPVSPLEIKPLPKAPPGFTGMVGEFRGQASWSAGSGATGASVNLRLVLEGTGSLEGLRVTTPSAPGAQVYEGGRSPRAGLQDGKYVATDTISFSVVPVEVGTLQFPPFEIVVFSPTVGAYETLRVDVPPLPVAQGTGTTAEVRAFSELPTPEAEVAVDDGPRPLRATGSARRLAVEAPLRAGLQGGLGALGAMVAFGAGMRGAAWAASRRKVAAPRPLTLAERMRALPEAPNERPTALDAIIRDLLTRVPGEAAPLHRDLSRLRFGDGVGDLAAIEAATRAVVAKVEAS